MTSASRSAQSSRAAWELRRRGSGRALREAFPIASALGRSHSTPRTRVSMAERSQLSRENELPCHEKALGSINPRVVPIVVETHEDDDLQDRRRARARPRPRPVTAGASIGWARVAADRDRRSASGRVSPLHSRSRAFVRASALGAGTGRTDRRHMPARAIRILLATSRCHPRWAARSPPTAARIMFGTSATFSCRHGRHAALPRRHGGRERRGRRCSPCARWPRAADPNRFGENAALGRMTAGGHLDDAPVTRGAGEGLISQRQAFWSRF